RTQRLVAPPGPLKLSYRAVVRDSGALEEQPFNAREIPVADLPNYTMHYLSGSRYCETDELAPIAWQLFGNVPPGYARVKAICDFVHNHIKFDYQAARSTRTAAEAYKERTGVCRDFAHLAISFCRCLNIPAAYVNGYLGDIGVPPDPAPMDFSAWFEAYIDHRWVTFDARHNKPRTGRIVIARGRDAADVAMITSFGQHYLGEFKVICEEVAPQRAEQLSSRAA
ncbi:MAG: transglutaminase family protein, partial [Hyphomicrobium sp.]|nr:transglutaminase family protein [Hyphomicrobium sp.]